VQADAPEAEIARQARRELPAGNLGPRGALHVVKNVLTENLLRQSTESGVDVTD
jgi:hypothetical protein